MTRPQKNKLTAAGFEPSIFSGIHDRGSQRIEIDHGSITLRKNTDGAWLYVGAYSTVDRAITAAEVG